MLSNSDSILRTTNLTLVYRSGWAENAKKQLSTIHTIFPLLHTMGTIFLKI
jgi:hypothetical protein